MKALYIIKLRARGRDGTPQPRNYCWYGTEINIRQRALELLDTWHDKYHATDIKIDVLRVDNCTHIERY